jgi:hypothetical protein
VLGEKRGDGMPLQRVLRPTVQQDDRGALSTETIVQLFAVEGFSAMFEIRKIQHK